jgi:hypothetical protein
MKILASLLVLLLSITHSKSQITVQLRSGNFINHFPEKNPSNDVTSFADNIYDARYYLWLQFNQLPSQEQTDNLIASGITLHNYLPQNTYLASFPLNYNFNLLKQYNVYAVSKPIAAAKIDVTLYTPTNISWAVAANGNFKVTISIASQSNINFFMLSLKAMGIEFNNVENVSDDMVILEASLNNIFKIAAHPLVQYIEPIGHPAALEDIQALTNHRNTSVQSSDNWITGKKLDGKGVVIAVGDNGFVGPHIDFQGRILVNANDMTAANTHGDHCAGIILGAGNLNPQVRGQAPGANLMAYDYYAPYSLFPSIYSVDKVRVVSHSLGESCNAGYDANAVKSDQLIRLYPSLMYVHSAGNSGTSSCGGLIGWRNITGGYKAGKNVITVANLSKTDVADASSSRGPLSDGRIKPDISAVGTSVNSTQPDNTFAILSGTSMACPAVAGNVAVMYQAYKNKNAGAEPEGVLIKAIALNTADDLGNIGPDFVYGWGRINTRKAVDCIENVRYFSGTVTTGVTKAHTINIPANVATAKVMVYWGDKEGTAGAAKSLVNNLDCKLISDAATDSLPWTLDIGAVPDETTVSNPAVKGIDSVNNMEQIQLDNPNAGMYSLRVLGTKVPVGPQKYWVIYQFEYANEVVVTYPNGGESFAPSVSQRIRWDATSSVNTFKLEYSINGGNTWATINNTIAGDKRYYDWSPSTSAVSKNVKIRITQGSTIDMSDTSFVILKVPTAITFTDVCQGTTKISWAAVASATGYDVFKLGAKYMEVVASTTTATNVTLNDVGDTLNWFAVRAKLGTAQANGLRSNAVSHTNASTVNCPLPLRLISFNASIKNNAVQLDWVVANEDGMINYIVEKSVSPNFDKAEMVGQIKPTNNFITQSYQLFDRNIKYAGTWYYRLKMIDANKTLYSNIRSVKLDAFVNELFSIYPNPSVGSIRLVAQNDFSNVVVRVFNELGKEVITKNIATIKIGEKHNLSTATLANGNYFVSVVNAENGVVVFKQQVRVFDRK